jgi:hypothetical protein
LLLILLLLRYINAHRSPHRLTPCPPLTPAPPARRQVIAWYDNEWGYSQRVLDLAELCATKWE